MTRSLWWLCLIFIVPLLAESDSFTIQSRFSGFDRHGRFKELQSSKLRFRCSPSVEASTTTQCRQLAAVLLAARTAARDEPANWLGVTPEWLAANVDQAITEDLSNVTWLSNPTPGRIALFRAAFLNPKTLAGLREVTVDADPEVRIQVKSGRRLKADLHAWSFVPTMAPWSVRLGSEMFEAQDHTVGEALCPLLPENFTNRTRVCGTDLRFEYADRVATKISDEWKQTK